jgi:hypothetical protein
MGFWSLVDLRVHACEPHFLSIWLRCCYRGIGVMHLHWDLLYLTVSQEEEEEEETFWKSGIFSHYCYKRDDLCQILKFLPQTPCEMLAVKVASIAPLWYSRKTPKRHQADLSSNK